MINTLRRIGQRALSIIASIGRASILWGRAVMWVPRPREFSLFTKQMYHIGVLSIAIVALSAFCIGAVISLQFYTQLARFGAQEAVGVGLALVLLRELGPVVTALLFAGRAGSAITAEIGLMKTTEQLASMEMMGVDPLRRVVAPRLWAGIISMPLLAALFNVIALYAGVVVAVDWLGADSGGFWSGINEGVQLWRDLGKGMVKTVVFAMVITWIAVYQGYDTDPTAEGVGLATTRTVVRSSVLVLALDFVMTLAMYGDL